MTSGPCAEGQLFLLLLANGMKSPSAREAFRMHATSCERCRTFTAEAVAARAATQAPGEDAPAPGEKRVWVPRPVEDRPAPVPVTDKAPPPAGRPEPRSRHASAPARRVVTFRRGPGGLGDQSRGRWRSVPTRPTPAARRSAGSPRREEPAVRAPRRRRVSSTLAVVVLMLAAGIGGFAVAGGLDRPDGATARAPEPSAGTPASPVHRKTTRKRARAAVPRKPVARRKRAARPTRRKVVRRAQPVARAPSRPVRRSTAPAAPRIAQVRRPAPATRRPARPPSTFTYQFGPRGRIE